MTTKSVGTLCGGFVVVAGTMYALTDGRVYEVKSEKGPEKGFELTVFEGETADMVLQAYEEAVRRDARLIEIPVSLL